LSVSSCSSSSDIYASSYYDWQPPDGEITYSDSIVTRSYDGISFVINNANAHDADVKILYPPERHIVYGLNYQIYRYSKNKWNLLKMNGNLVNDLMLYKVNSNSFCHLYFDLLYNGLEPGTYRFVQGIWVDVAPQAFFYENGPEPKPIYLYTDFIVK